MFNRGLSNQNKHKKKGLSLLLSQQIQKAGRCWSEEDNQVFNFNLKLAPGFSLISSPQQLHVNKSAPSRLWRCRLRLWRTNKRSKPKSIGGESGELGNGTERQGESQRARNVTPVLTDWIRNRSSLPRVIGMQQRHAVCGAACRGGPAACVPVSPRWLLSSVTSSCSPYSDRNVKSGNFLWAKVVLVAFYAILWRLRNI